MGFFQELKEDLSQAVNELLPEEETGQESKKDDEDKALDDALKEVQEALAAEVGSPDNEEAGKQDEAAEETKDAETADEEKQEEKQDDQAAEEEPEAEHRKTKNRLSKPKKCRGMKQKLWKNLQKRRQKNPRRLCCRKRQRSRCRALQVS